MGKTLSKNEIHRLRRKIKMFDDLIREVASSVEAVRFQRKANKLLKQLHEQTNEIVSYYPETYQLEKRKPENRITHERINVDELCELKNKGISTANIAKMIDTEPQVIASMLKTQVNEIYFVVDANLNTTSLDPFEYCEMKKAGIPDLEIKDEFDTEIKDIRKMKKDCIRKYYEPIDK